MIQITNTEFLKTVFHDIEDHERIWVCQKPDAVGGSWLGRKARLEKLPSNIDDDQFNNYFAPSTFQKGADGRKDDALEFLYLVILDDVNQKAAEPSLPPSYVLRTSAGSEQWGYLLDTPIMVDDDVHLFFDRLRAKSGVTDQGACKAGQYYRLPNGRNNKPDYDDVFRVELIVWEPDNAYTLEQLTEALGLEAAPGAPPAPAPFDGGVQQWRDNILTGSNYHDSEIRLAGHYAQSGMAVDRIVRELRGLYEGSDAPRDERWNTRYKDVPRSAATAVEKFAPPTLELPRPYKGGLPDLKMTKDKQPKEAQLATIPNLRHVLEEMGITLHFNVQTWEVEMTHPSYAGDMPLKALVGDAHRRLGIGNERIWEELWAAIAAGNKYHPMEVWLQGLEWDGEDHIQALADSVSTESKLWPVYLRKWLIQAVSASCAGWRRGGVTYEHCLVMAGQQGVGKSEFFRRLAPSQFFRGDVQLSLSGFGRKDDVLGVLDTPVVELAELDSTFKRSEVGALKNFLSTEIDKVRAPYARTPITAPRRTVFCGTVNNVDFLMDGTGSRRFWPIWVDAMDWDHGVDMAQLWAQSFALWKEGEPFTLTRSEGKQREEEARGFDHETVRQAQFREALEAAIEKSPDKSEWVVAGLHDLARATWPTEEPRHMSPQAQNDLSNIAARLFGVPRKIGGVRKRWRVPCDIGPGAYVGGGT